MIAVIVPTRNRKEVYSKFLEAWTPLFNKHNVHLIKVIDGKPEIEYRGKIYPVKSDLIYTHSDVVRNAGFMFAKEHLDPDIYITLDDDTLPYEDTIQDHIDALSKKVSIHWMNVADYPMRGLPYNTRDEAQVVLSHGVWFGVPDLDAPNQLVNPNVIPTFYKGVIPQGVYYPMCAMNIAFRKEALPYMYQVPMGVNGLDRFGDIWSGVLSKRDIDENGWAVVSGYSAVIHERASNVFKNLQKEARGIELNEDFWKGKEDDPYYKLMRNKRKQWIKKMK